MNMEYKEPVFKVVVSSAQDVIATSGEETNNYNFGQFEIGEILPLD
jgi:hypothetical protein